MPKNTAKPKAINLPKPSGKSDGGATLPVDFDILNDETIRLSFELFDRQHELFNLGGNEKEGTIGGKWFLHLIDRLKEICSKKVQELKRRPYLMHEVEWEKANANCPFYPQANWQQFRINKSRGHVIGILIERIFYVVWLDPYHNLIDIEGYGGVEKHRPPNI